MQAVQYPSDSSAWEMSPAVVWGVWSHTFRPFLLAGKKEQVTFAWILASPGSQGLAEIAGPKGYPSSLILALPLQAMQAIVAGAEVMSQLKELRWQGATELPLDMQSLRALVAEGERVVQQKDYRAVVNDVRPVAPGHPADWLYYQRNPAATQRLRALVDEVRAGT